MKTFITKIFILKAMLGTISSSRPNIVLILVDDWGWNDLSIRGSTEIPTPNLDALAANGVLLNNYYTHATCTPSRAALMTGYYASTIGMQNVLLGPSASALPLNISIFPQWLSNLGYSSHIIGKWHLGHLKYEYTPTHRGFESHYGFWSGFNDFYQHTWELNIPKENLENVPFYEGRADIPFIGVDFWDDDCPVEDEYGSYLTDLYTKNANKLIKNHDSKKPLFLFLSHHGVHRGSLSQPIIAPLKYTKGFDYIKDKDRKNYAGALKAVDESVGIVMKGLYEKGMLENSIVVVSSDNGASTTVFTRNGGSNYPLRGGKHSMYEGGMKANAIVWSSMLQDTGFQWNGLMHISDWLPTLYSAAGGNPADLHGIDGLNLWEVISKDQSSLRDTILLHDDPNAEISALRFRQFKYISDRNGTLKKPKQLLGVNVHDYSFSAPVIDESVNFHLKSYTSKTLTKFYNDKSRTFKSVRKMAKQDCGIIERVNPCITSEGPCLYHMVKDPCENNNIADQHPQIMLQMQEKLQELQVNVKPPIDSMLDYNAIPAKHNFKWIPWLDPKAKETLENCELSKRQPFCRKQKR